MQRTGRGGYWVRCLSIILIIAVGAAAILIQPETADARIRERVAGTTPPSYMSDMSKPTVAFPVFEYRLHSVGQVWLTPTNFGLIGIGNAANPVKKIDLDALGINYSPSFQFPSGTRNEYLYAGGLYVGGIIGTDTLVTLGIRGQSEEIDEWNSYDTVSESSSLRTSRFYDPNAKAHQQFHAVFSDTFVGTTIDEVDQRPHRPLNVEISQTSYAWSDRFSRQFVTIEYWIKNMGDRPISKMAMGIYMDADVFNDETSDGQTGSSDDFSGFLLDGPSQAVLDRNDFVNIAWVADNDGDPVGGSYPRFSPRGVVGMRIIHAPPVEDLSFNWWLLGVSQDWGPTKLGSRTGGVAGSFIPEGDRNVYYVMTNGERDYGQLFANVDMTEQGWRPPPRAGGCDIANGDDTRQLLSVGPTIDPVFPGDSVPFVVTFMGGFNFHTDPNQQFVCEDPAGSIAQLDFNDLIFSASWSSWIYDAPGIDSDGDGYRGEYHLVGCDSTVNGIGHGCDTVYYTGDLGPPPGPRRDLVRDGRSNIGGGAPDFAGPEAPPCPIIEVETQPSEIIVRWSGRETETRNDPILRQPDFEEYRLYIGRINTIEQYSLLASWDVIDYNTYVYDTAASDFVRDGLPASPEELEDRYGAGFDPDKYILDLFRSDTVGSFEDSVFVNGMLQEVRLLKFTEQSFNQGNRYENEFGDTVTNVIQRLGDSTIIDPFTGDTLTFGYYEARITNMNASVGQYISVTAWDFGNPFQRLDPSESGGGPGTSRCTQFAIPIYSADVVTAENLEVSVFPNPYKIRFDGPGGQPTSYFEQGFEAPQKFGTEQGIAEQDRRIWFINLPPKATIKIYTLDGDLVRTIEHVDPSLPEASTTSLSDYSSRTAWDLVTRNAQAAVSGIYIWRVESEYGSQTGKLVIIK